MKARATLFGGALMAAGLNAHAQQFIYQDTGFGGAYASYAESYAAGGPLDTATRPDALNTISEGGDALFGTSIASTSQTADSMRTEAMWLGDGFNNGGYAFARIVQFFQVDQTAELLFEWDFSGTDGTAALFLFESFSGSDALFSVDGSVPGTPTSGSETITVEPGVEFFLGGGLTDAPFDEATRILEPNATQFLSVTLIPAPGTAGAMGIMGVGALRRRRR